MILPLTLGQSSPAPKVQIKLLMSVCVGLFYMLHNGYCDGAFPMHEKAKNDSGKKEILKMVFSRYDQDDDLFTFSNLAQERGRLTTDDCNQDDDFVDRSSAPNGGRRVAAALTSRTEKDARNELKRCWAMSCRFQPLWKIRNYFGEKIALYFAWCGMLIMTLWIPMLLGFGVFLHGLYLRSVTQYQ